MTHLRLPQVAQHLGISPRSLRQLAATDPEFPLVKLGPKLRIVPEDELKAYLEKRRNPKAARRSDPKAEG